MLKLSLSGALDLDAQDYLNKMLERLAASVFYLEHDQLGLRTQASTSDLGNIDQTGFVGAAVNKLLKLSEGEESDTARLALQILYSKYKAIEESCR